MTTEQLTYWMQGFLEAAGNSLTEEQLKIIKDKLANAVPYLPNQPIYIPSTNPWIQPNNPYNPPWNPTITYNTQ